MSKKDWILLILCVSYLLVIRLVPPLNTPILHHIVWGLLGIYAIWCKRHLIGCAFMLRSVGGFLNTLVMAFNNWKMPIVELSHNDREYVTIDASTRLTWLSDVIYLRLGLGVPSGYVQITGYFSIGDVLYDIGTVLFGIGVGIGAFKISNDMLNFIIAKYWPHMLSNETKD